MTRYLLDTNVVSRLVRDPRDGVIARVAAVGEEAVCTSIVVAAELRYGAEKSGSRRLLEQVEAILAGLSVLPLEPPAEVIYGQIRSRLEAAGSPIGANDLLIAAHAIALGTVLVTDNVGEFSRVEGLQLENWLR